MLNASWKSNLLLRRTVGYIFICGICLGFISVSIELYSTYGQELAGINEDLDQIEQSQLETLITNAWMLNNDGIQIQLNSLVQHPDIIYLEYVDSNKSTKVTAGEKPVTPDDTLSRTIPLYYDDRGHKNLLGSFFILVSLEPTKALLYQRIPFIALSQFLKIIVLCLLIIWIIYHLFSRHLTQIAQFTNSLDIDRLHNRLILERKEKWGGNGDELSQIVEAINELQDRILDGLQQKEQAETALRKKDELFQLATEAASLGIWDWDMVTNETYFNPTYFTMLGYEPDELPQTYDTWVDLMHKDDLQKVADEMNESLAHDNPWRLEFRLRTKQGKYKWIVGSGKVVEKDAAGKPVRASGIHLDISESKSLEEDRQKVIKLESVGILAGGIAHDFNNILAAILGNIELAAFRVKKESRTFSLLSHAQKATKRAAKLTQQLLTFSKGGDPVKETTSLEDLVKDSADFVLHGAAISCEYSFDDVLWPVNADSGQLGQVIQNIVLNGIHSMANGGTLKIRCENVKDTSVVDGVTLPVGDFVCISIEDSGSGIPDDVKERIFDPYYTTKPEGSGLGLAICHSIITKHDGQIAVESTLGVGTTFSVYLPAVSSGGVIHRDESPLQTTVKGASILVMDDEEMIRDVAHGQLSLLGHDAILVANGDAAIQTFMELQNTDSPIDLVIMDLTIPGGMGGAEAARKLLELVPDAKIVVASGYSNDPVMANYKQFGFCAAIVKPFHLDELRNCIETVLAS